MEIKYINIYMWAQRENVKIVMTMLLMMMRIHEWLIKSSIIWCNASSFSVPWWFYKSVHFGRRRCRPFPSLDHCFSFHLCRDAFVVKNMYYIEEIIQMNHIGNQITKRTRYFNTTDFHHHIQSIHHEAVWWYRRLLGDLYALSKVENGY